MSLTKDQIKKSPEIALKLIEEMEKRNKLQEEIIDLQNQILKK